MSEAPDRPEGPADADERPEGKRARNRRERIASLERAGLALFLARGIEVVTIEEITQGAGVAKGTFYRYFDDKSALVASLLEPVAAACDDAFRAFREELEHTEDVEALVAGYVRLGGRLAQVVFAYADETRFYLQERRGPPTPNRLPVHHLATHLEEAVETFSSVAVERGLLRPFSPVLAARIVIGAIEQILFTHFSGRDLGDPLSLTRSLTSLVLDGLVERR